MLVKIHKFVCEGDFLQSNEFRFEVVKVQIFLALAWTVVLGQSFAIPGMAQPDQWMKMVGTQAPEWSNGKWINSRPLSLEDLKGKVVLIRWWLETCPYCQASASSLNEFYAKYSEKGLVIIGMYHPKPLGRKVSVEEVEMFTQAKEFKFPIAIDEDWTTLNNYWFEKGGEGFTSVSFIIDQGGVIQYVHPGGSYNKNGLPYNDLQWKKDYFEVKEVLENLLE